jgi:paraquat-inducible protein B
VTETNHQPHIKARKTADLYFSPIWILPVLALVITIWLVVRVTMDSKIPITIAMQTAEGIAIGKTHIKFRGINSGVVTDIVVTDDLSQVIVHAEVEPSISSYLTTDTQFWMVSPEISLAGVSGLETVLSGDYIAMQPSNSGDSTRTFEVLKNAPLIVEDDPGLRLTLQADKLGSVSEGSRLYYRQIPIGEVRYFQLSEDSKSVRVNALIEDQYSHLVNQSTVFWNSGGIRLKGSLSGFEIQTESLSAVLAGGVSLFTPDDQAKSIDETTIFDLHEDYDAAGVGVPVKVHFPSGYDLKSGITQVKSHGIKIGHVDSIQVASAENKGVVATVIIDPGAEAFLQADTQFWLVKADFSLSNLSNLETLISGNYITIKVGDSGHSSREFYALNGPPPPDFSEPGLHLYLRAETMNSLSIGTPIMFKGVEVGRVADTLIGDLTKGVGFHLQIRPEFSNLINSSTRFWNRSGLDVSAGLSGVKIRSESITSIIRGGIAFDTPLVDAPVVENGHEFFLLDSKDGSESKISFFIRMKSAESLEPRFTKIRYKGFEAGNLRAVTFDSSSSKGKEYPVIAEFGLDPRFSELLNENSIFWLVKPKLKASEITGLDAIIGGVYFNVQVGEGAEQREFILAESAPALNYSAAGLHLKLTSKTAASLQPGSGVYYQEIEVGTIQSIELNKDDDNVTIYIHIQPEYENRVKPYSQFYNVSGVSIKASAAGLSVNTASMDSLLSGGVAFSTEAEMGITMMVEDGESFQLFDSHESALQQGFNIVLDLLDSTAVKVGASITYKGIVVGEVTKSKLNMENKSVELTANIQNNLRPLITSNSLFWLAKTELGLLRQKNLGNLLSGPELRLIPGEGELQNKFSVVTYTPVIKTKITGLNIVMETSELGSVTTGVPVYYRQITVGEVLGFELSNNADKVLVYVNIEERYQSLVRANSKFWNTSGIDIEAGLFSGVEIKSESLESIIGGGISFATPDKPGTTVESNYRFELNNEMDSDWKEWQPKIPLVQ